MLPSLPIDGRYSRIVAVFLPAVFPWFVITTHGTNSYVFVLALVTVSPFHVTGVHTVATNVGGGFPGIVSTWL
jgi:hypothetical protein